MGIAAAMLSNAHDISSILFSIKKCFHSNIYRVTPMYVYSVIILIEELSKQISM